MYQSVGKAEKEELLEAEGKSWPVCKCHNERMIWDAHRHPNGGTFRCKVIKRIKSRRLYLKHREEGRCWRCEKHTLECYFNIHCYECRTFIAVKKIDKDIIELERKLTLDKNDPEYIAIVRKEQSIG